MLAFLKSKTQPGLNYFLQFANRTCETTPVAPVNFLLGCTDLSGSRAECTKLTLDVREGSLLKGWGGRPGDRRWGGETWDLYSSPNSSTESAAKQARACYFTLLSQLVNNTDGPSLLSYKEVSLMWIRLCAVGKLGKIHHMQLFPSMLMIWSNQRWAFYNYKCFCYMERLKEKPENPPVVPFFGSRSRWLVASGISTFPTTSGNLGSCWYRWKSQRFPQVLFWVVFFPTDSVILVHCLAACPDFQESERMSSQWKRLCDMHVLSPQTGLQFEI